MMGSSAVTAGAAPLADLAALIEVIKDPKLYDKRMSLISDGLARLDKEREALDAAVVKQKAEAKRLEALEADLAKREASLADGLSRLNEERGLLAADTQRLADDTSKRSVLAAKLAADDAALDDRSAEVKKSEAAARRLATKVSKAKEGVDEALLEAQGMLAAVKSALELASTAAVALGGLSDRVLKLKLGLEHVDG